MFADKLSLALAVGTFAMPADVACLRRVARIDKDNGNALPFGLVGHELPQLKETPVAEPSSQSLASRCLAAVANAREVFKGNADAECLCFGDDLLTDPMVLVSLKVRLPLRHLPQATTGRASATPLVGLSCPASATARRFDRLSAVCGSRVVRGDLNDAEINAKVVADRAFLGIGELDNDVKEEHAVAINEIRLPTFGVQTMPLVLATNERHDFTTRRSNLQADAINALEPIVFAVAIGNTGQIDEYRKDRLVLLQCLNSLSDDTHGHVSGKAKAIPNLPVDMLLKFDLVGATHPKRYTDRVVRGSVERSHSVGQSFGLFGIRQQLNLHDEYHKISIGGFLL